MRVNTIMPKGLKQFYKQELDYYRQALLENNFQKAWGHLERSHIIGQSYPFEHTYSHWLMLKFGFRRKDLKEIIGQIIRLLVGGWKSFIDHVPVGNTGGANVPPLKTMEIPNDLKTVLIQYRSDL